MLYEITLEFFACISLHYLFILHCYLSILCSVSYFAEGMYYEPIFRVANLLR